MNLVSLIYLRLSVLGTDKLHARDIVLTKIDTISTLMPLEVSLVAQSCLTLYDPMDCSTLGISWSLLKLMSIESVMPSNHCPLLLLPSIFPGIRVFHNVSVFCIRWPKYWSFSLSISPSNEHLGLIFSRIDWFDLLAAQGTLKSLFQHHGSKASIL